MSLHSSINFGTDELWYSYVFCLHFTSLRTPLSCWLKGVDQGTRPPGTHQANQINQTSWLEVWVCVLIFHARRCLSRLAVAVAVADPPLHSTTPLHGECNETRWDKYDNAKECLLLSWLSPLQSVVHPKMFVNQHLAEATNAIRLFSR